jgi:predicted transcriptional regulator
MTDRFDSRYGNAGDVGAPYQPSSDTSREAAISKAQRLPEERTAVYRAIVRSGETGRTWSELVEELGLSPTANGRVLELREMGLIVDSGRRRKTKAGRNAAVYVATPMETRS